MINFFVTQAGSHSIRDYLQARGLPIVDRMRVVEYERLGAITRLPLGGTVFAALDQTTAAATAAAALIHNQLSAAVPSVPVLNDPRRVLRRFDLLTRLYETGCNRFSVIRALDDPSALRFPVFIRPEHRHDGSLTPLLHNRRALDRALAELVFRGIGLTGLLIVEFCDTSDGDGLFRKYSAMRIGDIILPRHLHVSRDWVTKSENALREASLVKEELAYVEDHPHERWLWHVFNMAQIGYGRIDYGIYRGEPQAWEINMNPTLGRNAARAARPDRDRDRHLREPGRAMAHRRMLEAFRRIDLPAVSREIPIVIDPLLSTRLGFEEARAGRSAAMAAVARIGRYPRIRRLVKTAVFTAAAPIAPMLVRAMRLRHRHRPTKQRNPSNVS